MKKRCGDAGSNFLSMQFRDSPVSTCCCEEQAFQTQNEFQLYGCLLSDKIHGKIREELMPRIFMT